MIRFAGKRRVLFFEEPVFEDGEPRLRSSICPESGVKIVTPILPRELSGEQAVGHVRALFESVIQQHNMTDFVAWYYTPMALEFSRHLNPALTVYDCMDELSAFAGAPPAMRSNELELFQRAQLVFTGGASLFESKRKQHPHVHLFPSSVDVSHFARARAIDAEPEDQVGIPRPRLGYAGVIDERMDLDLLGAVAQMRPEWHFVLLGPVVKIDPATLPQAPNIHYLGMKTYADLPSYLAGWDIGMLPFAMNDSTRFISPTKTPEYLASGLRVISTPIRDVVMPYGDLGLVGIAKDAGEFVRVADSLLVSPFSDEFRTKVDSFLAQSSWDTTWRRMNELINAAVATKRADPPRKEGIRTANSCLVMEGAERV